MMASRFVATRESQVHENIKNELIRRQEFETVLFGKSIGLQGRAIKNKVIEEILSIEGKGGGLKELIPLMGGERIKEVWEGGNVDSAPLMVGQSIGLIKKVLTCQELLDTMAREAAECLRKTNQMLM
jgi:nitronate monooxygenase